MSRKVSGVLLAVLIPLLAAADPSESPRPATPDFQGIKALARQMAARSYSDHRIPLSARLSELSYDQLRQIVFDDRKSVWRREKLPFQLQFFHPGGARHDQVDLNLVDGEDVVPFPFTRDFFVYDPSLRFNWMDFRSAKFAGFRVLYPLNRPEKLDELIAFQGASYFRAVPAGYAYGLSARALTVNCGGDGPEEFPRFEEFWIDRPDREGRILRLRGVFDSPSVAGAAEFSIEPGAETVTRVTVALYPRADVAHCGIAPLTSMYWMGDNTQRRFDEARPEVHDSDGLQIQNGAGEWLWRPLDNTGRMRLSAFVDKGPKGFGLIQRERDPVRYRDLHAQYHRRPSAWVRPVGDWGAGSVRLIEIPTDTEFSDNIVAFWEPANPLKTGEAVEFAYDVLWYGEKNEIPPLGRVVGTRTGAVRGQPRARQFMLDFAGPGIETGAGFNPEVIVTVARGKVSHQTDEYNPFQHTWRVAFEVAADDGAEAVELRVRLRKGGGVCAETWTYCWTP